LLKTDARLCAIFESNGGDREPRTQTSFRGASEAREPGIQFRRKCLLVWIPGSRHSASKTRVNALMRRAPE
jgi:hypothetical protein